MAIVRRNQNLVVPARFAGGGIAPGNFTDILFHNRRAGLLRVYRTDGRGSLRLIHSHDTHHGWTHIVPGRYGGSDTAADYLLYDSASGLALFLTVNAEHRLISLRRFTIQRGWTHLVRGRFVPSGVLDDLLFYNADTGRASFYATDGRGRLTRVRTYTWERGWTHVVPGNFGGSLTNTDLLLYRREHSTQGIGRFYTTGELATLQTLGATSIIAPPASHIVAADFLGDATTDLLFYDSGTGDTQIHATNGQGQLQVRQGYNFNFGSRRWEHIISGRFGDGMYTDLLFYDANEGLVEIWATTGTQLAKLQAPPYVRRFRVEPRSIDYRAIEQGSTVQLSWDVREAGTIDIQPAIGPTRASGQANLAPRQTTTYRLTARNEGGVTRRATRVVLHGAPIVPEPPVLQTGIRSVLLEPHNPFEANTPYVGTLTLIGHTGNLVSISAPGGLGALSIRFPKAGHSTDECNNPAAVVTLQPGQPTTPDQIAEIFGTPNPAITPTLTFIACTPGPVAPGQPVLITATFTFV